MEADAESEGNSKMIVTAEDLWNDPLTIACVPMAREVAKGPEERYVPGHTNFRGRERVLFLGHGHPGGELLKVDASQLIADLADGERGVGPDTEVLLWSCFAAAGRTGDDNLVSRIRTALSEKGITGVRISGVAGALYTNTLDGRLYSGPTMQTKDAVTPVIQAIRDVEGHAWAESGLMGPKMKTKWDRGLNKPVEVGFDLKQVKVDIGTKGFDEGVKQIVLPPNSVAVAVYNLVKSGKLPSTYETEDRHIALEAIDIGVKEWYRTFFAHPIIVACLEEKVIRPWEEACLRLTT
ncbi:hypothetical protein [Actinoallomurus sp. CA-142502]|uniref:hypothetical protein n=1 Tax=Actinoallomurus sp. CA-142502 TaxID=3239885 RepID=UPI003D8B09AD